MGGADIHPTTAFESQLDDYCELTAAAYSKEALTAGRTELEIRIQPRLRGQGMDPADGKRSKS